MLKIADAVRRIDDADGRLSGGIGHEALLDKRQRLFAGAHINGKIAMLDGGGAAPLGVLIETENGWLVRLSLDAGQARRLAAALLTHAGDE